MAFYVSFRVLKFFLCNCVIPLMPFYLFIDRNVIMNVTGIRGKCAIVGIGFIYWSLSRIWLRYKVKQDGAGDIREGRDVI